MHSFQNFARIEALSPELVSAQFHHISLHMQTKIANRLASTFGFSVNNLDNATREASFTSPPGETDEDQCDWILSIAKNMMIKSSAITSQADDSDICVQ